MAAKRIEYQIVGRYKDGKEVTDYHLQSIDSGKSGKFSREIVCYLAGRGQITNCTAQVYKDQVILRGNGMSLDDLPIINEDGELKNADGLGKVKKGTSAVDALEMFNIVGIVKSGRTVAGYVLQNAGCGIKKFKRPQVIEMARAGKIGNARVQTSNGREILRGIDCKLDELPVEKTGGVTKTEGNTLRGVFMHNFRLLPSGEIVPYKFTIGVIDNKDDFKSTQDELHNFVVDMLEICKLDFVYQGMTMNLYIDNHDWLVATNGKFEDNMSISIDQLKKIAKKMKATFIMDNECICIYDNDGNPLQGKDRDNAILKIHNMYG